MGSSSVTSFTASSENEFPTELPPYGVWWDKSKFTLHSSLSAIKGAVTNKSDGRWGWQGVLGNRAGQEIGIYERHGSAWIEIYHIKKGTLLAEHELWRSGSAPKTQVAVTEEDIAAVIESITGIRPEV